MKHTPEQPPIAYRAWVLSVDGHLRQVAMDGTWRPGVNVAECGGFEAGGPRACRHDLSETPSRVCTCGLYACDDIAQMLVEACEIRMPTAVGAVSYWGRVQKHARGVRAQYMRPEWIALLDSPAACSQAYAAAVRSEGSIVRAGRVYDVPVRDLRGTLANMRESNIEGYLYRGIRL